MQELVADDDDMGMRPGAATAEAEYAELARAAGVRYVVVVLPEWEGGASAASLPMALRQVGDACLFLGTTDVHLMAIDEHGQELLVRLGAAAGQVATQGLAALVQVAHLRRVRPLPPPEHIANPII